MYFATVVRESIECLYGYREHHPEPTRRGIIKSRSIPLKIVKCRLGRTKYSHIPCRFKYYKTLVLP